MSERTRDEGGKFVETITPARVLTIMRESDDPIVTASEIADALDCTPEAATKKLKILEQQGRVARRKVGARAVVWWRTETNTEPPLRDDGEHDPADPFFSNPPLATPAGEPIDVADTDELLGDALADEHANR